MQDVASQAERVNTRDMYGHAIVPIGDGFGVSVTFGIRSDGAVVPLFSLFHSSDGFRQQLFSVTGREEAPHRPQVTNIFDGRLQEVLALLEDKGRA